ncbi:MAG: hypothetical protein QW791_07245 [Candidatus Bathyarchaeia archaeon]
MNRKIALILIPLLLTSMIILSMPKTSAQVEYLDVGIIVPKVYPFGEAATGGTEAGAIMGALDINNTGGIKVGGTTYYIRLHLINEWSHPSIWNPENAKAELQAAIEAGVRYFIGGFRTEMLEILRDQVIFPWNDAHPNDPVLLLINGASTDELCKDWSTNPKYRWIFRVMPINSTTLCETVIDYLREYLVPKKLAYLFANTVKFACVAEEKKWTEGICSRLETEGLGPNATFYKCWRTPEQSGAPVFLPILQECAQKGVDLVVHIYTLSDVLTLVGLWNAYKFPFVLVGIDVPSQCFLVVDWTGGKCNYECHMMAFGTRNPIVPGITEVWWDRFVAMWNAWPAYTALGAYNGLLTLKAAIETAGSIDQFDVRDALEESEGIQLINGIGKFVYETHDVYCDSTGATWDGKYTRAFMVQWVNMTYYDPGYKTKPLNEAYKGFVLRVVSPVDQPFSKKFLIPPWIHPLGDYDLYVDGIIDYGDIGPAARAFGSAPGAPRWWIEADINGDSFIDYLDIGPICRNFGKTAPNIPVPDPP